jgi:hypothetical protein
MKGLVMTTDPRTEPVSERFYHRPRNIVAVLLALIAAIYNIGVMVWPIVPTVGRGDLAPFWRFGSLAISVLYLAGFFLADRRWNITRLLLVIGALAQVVLALIFSRPYEAASGLSGQAIGLFDFFPAALALIAALLLAPPPAPRDDPYLTTTREQPRSRAH